MNQNGKLDRPNKSSNFWIANGTKGVISLFLAILMLPFTTIACTLLDAARLNSAVAIFDEALCNASNSTLGTYDKFLKTRFGLLALSQDISGKGIDYTPEKLLKETFSKYMEENFGALSNVYSWEKGGENPNIQGLYPLSDPDVLGAQILQFSKYSVPTQLVADALSIEDWIKELEKGFLGHNFFDMISSGMNTADSVIKLGEDIDLLKGKIQTGNEALQKYQTKYKEFSETVALYLDLKAEAERVLPELEKKMNDAADIAAELQDQVNKFDLEIKNKHDEIEKLTEEDEKLLTNHEEEITDLREEIDKINEDTKTLREESDEANKEAEAARKIYDEKKKDYEKRISDTFSSIAKKRGEYSGAIESLKGALLSVKKQIITVQSDRDGVIQNTVSTISSGVSGVYKQKTESVSQAIKAKESERAAAEEEGNTERAGAVQAEIDALEKRKTEIEDAKTPKNIQATEKAIKEGTKTFETSFNDFNTEVYDEVWNKLDEVKVRVDEYDTSNVTDYLNPALYYYAVSGLVTKELVEQAEKDLVGSITGASIWAVIKAIFEFVKAILKTSLFFDPTLTAVLDLDYYKNNYHGLPGAGESYSKDRSKYPTATGNDDDLMQSLKYKAALGQYSSSSGADSNGFDVVKCIQTILSNFITLQGSVLGLANLTKIFKIGQTIKTIQTCWSTIVEQIGRLFEFLNNLLGDIPRLLGNKLLISGYAWYSTSDRTSRTGDNKLTGANYNMREQKIGIALPGSIGDLQAIIKTLTTTDGSKEKCFYGAETEYLIWGSTYEIQNQAAAFLAIFASRVLLNVSAVCTDPEVEAIANAVGAVSFGIGLVVVYGIYIILESFIDTVLLVNGGSVEFWKTGVYLTIAGLPTLVGSFFSVLSSKGKEELKDGIEAEENRLLEAFGSDNTVPTDGKYDLSKNMFNRIQYSEMMFLIMTLFTPQEKILARLSNIMEMEAVEYYSKQSLNDGTFDLDKSYTYLRVEADFKASRFLPFEVDPILASSKRLIYRGY